ncbi:hypothetical protein SEA_CUMBERBATCH_42 [Streptomyces phage Cumberbatch]|uniref:Mucin-2 n=1 Tax=Streptomyces phage Cumberbatch TaxID=2736271 RepID=A0A6M9Z7J3_9CAUD|nr:hypothetical protein QEN65_gp42 [Streptomyces phage Cumberbatch]QKN87684.1 hypothetical protein SEA_CUMBERBATCH_42 [Streptomyces phage Cumberbatch]
MTWFKVDDTAHMHPKLIKAGNAALGLWLRAGSYAAQHLTEGVIPGVVVQLYGTAPQARKLIAAGLWHEHGHTCPHPKCKQPAPGDYYVHDFLIYNPSRKLVEDGRAKAAERQARGRARQAEQRETRNESPSKSNSFAGETSAEKSESLSDRDAFQDEPAGQEGLSHRDGADPSRWSRPDPSRSTSYGGTNPPTPQGEQEPATALLTGWWARYGRGTAQSRHTIRRAITDALANGLDPQTLAAALDRLGQTSKPVTGGTLQFALSELRRPAPGPGADVIPLDPNTPRKGRAAQSADHLAAALARLEAHQ